MHFIVFSIAIYSNMFFYVSFSTLFGYTLLKSLFKMLLDSWYFYSQAGPTKDVTISDSAPSKLLLQKHVDYIGAYGTKKDDYVSVLTRFNNI